MRLVDVKVLFPDGKHCNMIYMQIPQPMTIYHSNEELYENVIKDSNIEHGIPAHLASMPIAHIIRNFGEYSDFLVKNKIDMNYNSNNRYIDLRPYNIWVRTIDEFIPDYAEEDGTIFYMQDNGQFISTNGCYIQLYFLTPTPARHVLYTSSGIHSVGMNKWDLTAAVRKNFTHEKDERKGKDKDQVYQDKLDKIIQKRKTTIQFIKATNAMFNPAATEYFLDADKALKMAFGNTVKQKDLDKLVQSKGFQMALQQTLKTIFPELAAAIKKKIPPDDMAQYLADAMGIAKDSKNVDSIIKVFEKVENAGYAETQVTNNYMPTLPPLQQMSPQPQITAKEVHNVEAAKDFMPNIAAEAGDGLTKEELNKRREETGSISSYVMTEEDLEDN